MNEENILQNTVESEAVVPLSNTSNSENLSTENVESTEVLETGTLADADFVVALGIVVLADLFLVACFGACFGV